MEGNNTVKKLKKDLGFTDVFMLAIGTTLSGGFFLLPGLAAEISGPAMILAYAIALIPLIPAMLSKIELATAMPKAGSVYFFLDRSLGPFFGTIGGVGIWITFLLKVAFALIGMGAYMEIFFPEAPIITIALSFAVILTAVNLLGAKKTSGFQIVLGASLLVILSGFIFSGVPNIDYNNFKGFFDAGTESIITTAGLVFVSYIGITKVASLAEEVKDPEKNLPRGIFASIAVAIVVYVLGTIVIVGIEPMNILKGDLTPVATTAEIFFGNIGKSILSIAAMIAFVSVANVGMMSASRYPLAMSRDHIFPDFLRKLNKAGVPVYGVLLTSAVVIIQLIFLNPMSIAKLASAFQLFIFALLNLAVIVMRESKIESYDPGYKSILYPWMQIFGIITSFVLIFSLGTLSMLFSLGLVVICILWYWFYAKNRVIRAGAIYHVFERLGRQRYDALDTELRGIMKEKGLRKEDPFEQVVSRARVLDIEERINFEEVVNRAASWLEKILPLDKTEIVEQIMEGTRIGATPVTRGVALPHFRAKGIPQTEMVLVRAKNGVNITLINPITHEEEEEQIVHALFFLISPEDNPAQHLRMLAQIAGRVEDESFEKEWNVAEDELDLKEALLHDERFLTLKISSKEKTLELVGKQIKELNLEKGLLVALLTRDQISIVPNGNTRLLEGDRLLIIGESDKLNELKKQFN
ncbi:MAG: amino acid permease [Ignavibacteria bacterium]|nr:MAG: amino acid permease [Ignavibacteria bacterium]